MCREADRNGCGCPVFGGRHGHFAAQLFHRGVRQRQAHAQATRLAAVEQAGGRQQGPVGIEAPAVVPHFAPQRAVAIFQMQVHARRAGLRRRRRHCSAAPAAGGRWPDPPAGWTAGCPSAAGRWWAGSGATGPPPGPGQQRLGPPDCGCVPGTAPAAGSSVATSARRSGSLTSAEISSASRVMVASGVFSSWAIAAACVARATMPSLRVKRSRSRASSLAGAQVGRHAGREHQHHHYGNQEVGAQAPQQQGVGVDAALRRPAEQGGQHNR